MSQTWPSKSVGNKVISTKLSREAFTRFQYYCKTNGETVNGALRRIILSEIDNPHPSLVAARSTFVYNRRDDNFNWEVVLDDGTICEIGARLPANSIEQLGNAIAVASEKRNTLLKRSKRDSVPFPDKLLRGMK